MEAKIRVRETSRGPFGLDEQSQWLLAFEMRKKRMELRDTEKVSSLHDIEMDDEGGGGGVKN